MKKPRMKDKYVAYYSANHEYEEHGTLENAKEWLEEQYNEDATEGYSQESCNGEDYIAHITHRSMYAQRDSKEKYKWDEAAQGYFNSDGEEWCSEHDEVGVMLINKVEEIQG